MNETQQEQLKKITDKGSMLENTGVLGMAKSFIEVEDKIESVNENIDSKLGEVAQAIRDIPKTEFPEPKDYPEFPNQIAITLPEGMTLKGEKGDSYILTEKDKKDIAKSIKVPIIEKVIEHTETIVEKPIVTNEIKEVAVTDTAEVIVSKINELPTDDNTLKIDASHIKNLPEFKNGNFYGGSGIKEVIAGTGVTIDNTNAGYPIVSATGSSLTLTTTGTSGAATYNSGTGVLNIPIYSAGSGGISRSINSISTPTTAGATASTDYIYIVTGTTTLTLPTAVGNTNRYSVKNTGSGNVTIACTGVETIDGGSTAILTASLQGAIDIISDGTSWYII